MTDNQLKFNLHTGKICLKSANKLNVLHFLRSEEKKVFLNLYVHSNFSYCPLVWMLENAKSVHKIQALRKRLLGFLINDYESSYEDLLKRSRKTSVYLRRTGTAYIEIFQTVNDLNPEFMKNLFKVH